MIDEIKRRLEAGEDAYISLTDPNGFREEAGRAEYLIQDMLNSVRLQVLEFGVGFERRIMVRLLNPVYEALIYEEDLSFFDIVDDCPTFDDLIDVALQAGKDGVLIGVRVDFEGIRCLRVEYSSREPVDQIFDYQDDYSEYVEHIKSLYTETFVIESKEDIKKLKSSAKVVLSNGEEVIFSNENGADESLWFEYNDFLSATIPYIALKGATVTQKRGSHD